MNYEIFSITKSGIVTCHLGVHAKDLDATLAELGTKYPNRTFFTGINIRVRQSTEDGTIIK